MTHFITQQNLEKLKEQFDFLTRVKRREINEAISTARAFGDLKENAEYHAAKEEQAKNEIKIAQLADQIASSQIIDDSQIPRDKVAIGARVKVKDFKYDEELEYVLVSELESDPINNKISVSSPVGKGLLGKKVNEIVTIEVPAGQQKYQILDISR